MNELEQARQTFFEESRDMLRQIEDALLALESGTQDPETLNGLFRAAHTIKGSAGLFGFDRIGRFTHEVETVLDRLRSGEIAFGPVLAALLLQCSDHIGHLLDETAQPIELPETNAAGEVLLSKLAALTNAPARPDSPAAATAGPEFSDAGPRPWNIRVRFGADVFRNGMDPLSFLRYLGTKGDILDVSTTTHGMPEAEAFDPESCFLSFEIVMQSAGTKEDIVSVFDFVKDDCTLEVLAPGDRISQWIDLLKRMPAQEKRMGDMLVECGAITRAELDRALRAQEAGPADQPLGQLLVSQNAATPEVVQAAVSRQREQRSEEAKFIRVQADKLDSLISLVGELVIAGAGANLLARQAKDMRMLEATQSITDLVEEIRNGALQLRMVQIGETFTRFRRVVRDVSQELGKQIELVISGAETELDKSVVEKIADPLMHLVRNSMDHGIEMPDARIAAGKPANGTLRLNAYHDSGSIVIEVIDDGKGLDRDRILQKAWERGLVASNAELTDQEVYGLIFMPGFSTAEKVTSLSGRGVGMDVVKRNIEALRGSVTLDSRPGAGTTISIRLPLTLAIIDGFLVTVGKSSFVVPLDMVVECIELPAETPAAAGYLNLRGEVLPFLRLREVFDIDAPAPVHDNVVVVRNGAQRAGFVVDRLLGEFQTVIKPLGRLFRNLQGIGGSTILGNGEVALILDVQ
ncbi:MAG: chemotaxis protein CheA, partial [Betaproteobacteria bacterium]|nr:chemotaxis protein CheA [Betaproteobacteria bacterium]